MADNSADDLTSDPLLKKYLKAKVQSAPAQTVPDVTAGDDDLSGDPILKKYLKPQAQTQAQPEPVRKVVAGTPGAQGLIWNNDGGYDPKTGELVVAGKPMSNTGDDGSWSQRIGAAAAGALDYVPFFGEELSKAPVAASAAMLSQRDGVPYDKAYEAVKGAVTNAKDAHPGYTVAGNVGGAVAGTAAEAAMLPGAAADWLLGTGGRTALGMAARGGSAAGIQGLVHGGIYSDDTSLSGRAQNALIEGGTGAAIGSALGGVMGGISNGVAAIGNKLLGTNGSLAGMPERARTWLTENMSPQAVADIKAGMGSLGDGATPADVSPMWNGVASGVGSTPEGRNMIFEPLLARDTGKNARINQIIGDQLGVAKSPTQVMEEVAAAKKAVGPQYEAAFDSAKAVDTQSVADDIASQIVNTRGSAQTALKSVRDMLNIPGTDVLDPHPRAVKAVREALDGMISDTKDKNVYRVLSGIRSKLDEQLAGAVPGLKDADAAYAKAAQGEEAFKTGQNIFDSGKNALRPEEFASLFNKADPSVQARIAEGARADIERIVGTNANDVAALNRYMKGEGDWNRAKLATTFGADKADAILSALDRETTFQATKNMVTGNSATEGRRQFNALIDDIRNPGAGIMSGVGLNNGFIGGIYANVRKAMRSAAAEEEAKKAAQSLGKIAVEQSPAEIDRLAQALAGRQRVAASKNKLLNVAGPASGIAGSMGNRLLGTDNRR